MSKISILELEQRFELEVERNRLEQDFIQRKMFNFNSSLIDLMNMHILELPFNKTSRNVEEYFLDRSIGESFGMSNVEIYLYRTNFYLNFILWYFKNICKPSDSSNKKYLKKAIFIKEVIIYTLEKLNYCSVYLEEDEHLNYSGIIFTKRSTEVDSVLPIVSKDIRIDLLSYLDFRNEKNLTEKEAIIARIYKDIEERKTVLDKDPYKSLFKSTKQALNYARHSHPEISVDDKICICDKSFYMYIHLVRWPLIREYQESLKNMVDQ